MNENKLKKVWVLRVLWVFLFIWFILFWLWNNYWNKIINKNVNPEEVVKIDIKWKKITKEEYLKWKGITDMTNDYQDKKKEYFTEISKKPSQLESYIFLWLEENILKYQTVHSERKYTEMKEKFTVLNTDILDEISNKVSVPPSLLKKIELLWLSKFDPFILEYQVDYNTKDRKITDIYKAKDFKYHYEEISVDDLDKYLLDNRYIWLVWFFEKKMKKDDLIELVKKIATKNRCNLSIENEVKRFVHESQYLELYKQKNCDKVVIWYFEKESGEKIVDRVYIDSFYTKEEKQIYLENYQTAGIETNSDDIIMTKLYYELNKKYPLIFF